MPHYSAYIGHEGIIIRTEILHSESDEEALSRAILISNGNEFPFKVKRDDGKVVFDAEDPLPKISSYKKR